MEHNELKPCPFCGEMPLLAKWATLNIACLNEKCPVAPEVWGDTQSEAISRWNTRPSDPVRQALVEAINDLLFVIEIPRHWGPSQMDAFRDAEAEVQAALDLARK